MLNNSFKENVGSHAALAAAHARTPYPRRQVVNFPRTYFEVKDVRPGEEQGQAILEEIFVSTPGGISIPKELNQNILQFLTGKELLGVKMASKTAEVVIKYCHALMYDAIHERIGELFTNQSRRQVNEHGFKVTNCMRVFGGGRGNSYCVKDTPKYVCSVCEQNIFRQNLDIKSVRNESVTHVRPYAGSDYEVMQHWHVWVSMRQEFLN